MLVGKPQNLKVFRRPRVREIVKVKNSLIMYLCYSVSTCTSNEKCVNCIFIYLILISQNAVSRNSPAKSKSLNVTGDAAANNKKGSSSPKLQSYRGTAEKCKFEGETVRHFNAGKLAVFELKAPGHKREDVEVSIISMSLY